MGLSRIDESSDSDNKGGFFSGFGQFFQYKRGNIAIISQSGMLNGGYLMHVMTKYPDLGFRYSCSSGNKMDLSEIEFLEYLIGDPTVNVIAIYLESFKDPRRFIQLCRKAKSIPNKTIILVKGGITPQGQKASLSHTGSLSGSSKLIDAIIKQAGVIQAHNFGELFQFARTFSMMYRAGKKLPKKGGVSLIIGSGGAGTIAADLTLKYGLNFPILSEKAYEALEKVFPEWMPPNRFALVDFWPAMEKAMMNKTNPEVIRASVFQALLNEPDIEGVFNMWFCSKMFSSRYNFDSAIEKMNLASKPIFILLIGEYDEVRRVSRLFNEQDIPTFTNLEDMIKNFAVLVQELKNKAKFQAFKN